MRGGGKLTSDRREGKRVQPVVHQQVRGPDQFRVDSDAFHASILAYIPVQLVVEPVLGNIFFEKNAAGTEFFAHQVQPQAGYQKLVLLILW